MFDFTIIKLMASIFTPEFIIRDKFSLISLLHDISDKKFDGDFFSGPIPHEIPPEIPRLILNSQDNSWKLEVSLDRTNLIFIKPQELLHKAPRIQDFGGFAGNLFSEYKNNLDIKIQRLALITERFSEITDTKPSNFIASRFCKEEYLEKHKPFNNTNGFELHSLKKYDPENFHINSWVRLKSSNMLDQTPILLVQNDINTLANNEAPNVNFSKDEITNFYNLFPDHIEEIIALYFR